MSPAVQVLVGAAAVVILAPLAIAIVYTIVAGTVGRVGAAIDAHRRRRIDRAYAERGEE